MGCGGSSEATPPAADASPDTATVTTKTKTQARRLSFQKVSVFFQEAGVPLRIQPSQILIEQGTSSSSLYLVVSGKLERRRRSDPDALHSAETMDGDESAPLVGHYGVGEMLGTAGFLLGSQESVRICAAGDADGVQLLEVSHSRAVQLVNDDATLAVRAVGGRSNAAAAAPLVSHRLCMPGVSALIPMRCSRTAGPPLSRASGRACGAHPDALVRLARECRQARRDRWEGGCARGHVGSGTQHRRQRDVCEERRGARGVADMEGEVYSSHDGEGLQGEGDNRGTVKPRSERCGT